MKDCWGLGASDATDFSPRRTCRLSSRIQPAMDVGGEPVIVVVGADTTDWAVRFASLRGASLDDVEVSTTGVHIYRRNSEVVVVGTTPLRPYKDWSVGEVAAAWVSMNALRSFSGKPVHVVCVLESCGSDDPVHERANFVGRKFNWLNLLAFIFKKNQAAIRVLVKVKGKADKKRIVDVLLREGFAKSKISFQKKNSPTTSRPRLERRKYHRKGTDLLATLTPCLLPVVNAKHVSDRHGHWGPVKVIVIGTTGSGKSTFAQMLTGGKLDPLSEDFPASSGARGETRQVRYGQGRGWYVVDTPGLGESTDKCSTVPTEEAAIMIYNDIERTHGIFTHFVYVLRKGRIVSMAVDHWNLFVRICGENIKSNFSILISGADQQWVNENEEHLSASFPGCCSFLSADFPPTKDDDKEWEIALQRDRMDSLQQLEEGLASLHRRPVKCTIGEFSRTNIDYFATTARLLKDSTFRREDRAQISAVTQVVKLRLKLGRMWKIAKRNQAKRFVQRLMREQFAVQ